MAQESVLRCGAATTALSKVGFHPPHLLPEAQTAPQRHVLSSRPDGQFPQLQPGSFCGLRTGTSIDPHAALVARLQRRCFPPLAAASEVARRSSCRSRLAALCPDWERTGRMNRVRHQGASPSSLSEHMLLACELSWPEPALRKTSKRGRRFLNASALTPLATAFVRTLQGTPSHLPSNSSCQNRSPERSMFHL